MIHAVLALLVLLAAIPATAQDAQPLRLRLTLDHRGEIWVGQRVTVTLTLMTPARFVGAIAWPELTASQGRIIVLPEADTLPGTERVGSESYVALTRSYTVFPATPGEVVLAPLSLRARVGGADGQPVEATASTEALHLTTRAPTGVADLARLVVAPSFSLRATPEGQTQNVHVGDAIVRTVTMQAGDSTAMLLPPVAWSAPDGVRVYPDPPVLQDHAERGELRALRTDRASFVPERAGQVELPGFSLQWLDPRRGQVQEVKVAPLRIEVLPASAPATAARRVSPWLAGAAGLVLIAALAGWWTLRHRRASGPDALADLARASRTGDATATLRALYLWADGLLPPSGERTLARLAHLAGVPSLDREARRLEAAIYGKGSAWDGRTLLAAARSTQRSLARHPAPRGHAGLPPLNPFATSRPLPRLTQPRWVR